jgi:hypothetical protein
VEWLFSPSDVRGRGCDGHMESGRGNMMLGNGFGKW